MADNVQYRYGFTPLYMEHHGIALSGEYLCDKNTGAPAIKDTSSNVITPGNNIQRLVYHTNQFAEYINNLNSQSMSIYNISFNDTLESRLIVNDVNLITSPFDITSNDGNTILLYFDLNVLLPNTVNIMIPIQSGIQVSVTFSYATLDGSLERTEVISLNTDDGKLIGNISIPNDATTKTIQVTNIQVHTIVESSRALLHSILIGCQTMTSKSAAFYKVINDTSVVINPLKDAVQQVIDDLSKLFEFATDSDIENMMRRKE